MNFEEIKDQVTSSGAILVAVSKTHPINRIKEIYLKGHRDFGENKVQELMDKVHALPDDIHWHMIGHLQSNKVKFLAPFVHLIHSLDRISLAKEINKEARKAKRIIPALIQIKIAKEDSKFGLDPDRMEEFMNQFFSKGYDHIRLSGVMGMATFTEDESVIREEFQLLERTFSTLKERYFLEDPHFRIKSYGMSSDYTVALDMGSNMVRIGSLIFGERSY